MDNSIIPQCRKKWVRKINEKPFARRAAEQYMQETIKL